LNAIGYSVADLEGTERELADLLEKESRYSGNNPNNYVPSIRLLMRRRDTIAELLKGRGEVPENEEEAVNRRLVEAFPNAQSKQVVTFESARHRKRFRPPETSRSGRAVTQWEHWWEPFGES
jgi:hypothetical protein